MAARSLHLELARGLFGSVLEAGQLQLALRRAGLVATQKDDASPVTEADQRSEALLTAALASLAPGIPIIGEEAVAAGHMPDVGDRFFLIDPLDGTREYVRGGDDFTVNVGLVVEGEPTFGIVYAPCSGWFCLTTDADTAVAADVSADLPTAAFDTTPWHRLRTRVPPEGGLVAVTSRSHKSSSEDAFLDGVGVTKRVAIGSSLKFCMVARGDADVYARFGPISEWDIAAGHAILLAAGGHVTARDGGPLRYGDRANKFLAKPFIAWGRRPG